MLHKAAGKLVEVYDVAQQKVRAGEVASPIYDAIAMKSFSEKEGAILTRTVARAMLKYAATEKAEDENEFLGFLVNMFGVSTEAADTRSWLSLPSKIYMARVDRSAGTDSLVVELLNGNGNVVESGPLPRIQVEPDRPVVVSYRSFK